MGIPPRIPESNDTGGAINDVADLDMETYSRFAKRYIGGEYRRFVGVLVDELAVPPNGTVLEIGPGPGWLGIWLAKRRPDVSVVGVELSADMIRVAEKNASEEGVGNVRFVQGDAAHLDQFEEASFDAVISNGSLHHWLDPVVVFDGIARILKPEGLLAIKDGRRDLGLPARTLVSVMTTVMAFDPSAPASMRNGWRSSIAAGYTPDELRTMLKRSSLRNCEIDEGLLDLLVHSPMLTN